MRQSWPRAGRWRRPPCRRVVGSKPLGLPAENHPLRAHRVRQPLAGWRSYALVFQIRMKKMKKVKRPHL
ncbi:hypothetical protein BHM03_00051727 [Ensete ventricosum]|nr:hypothetical protein BHM03_00051727 [Ensete ventricosum]